MRLLQLSDPHLLADPQGWCRGRQPLPLLRHALAQAHAQLEAAGTPADQLLISGDLCQDESWGGYMRLKEAIDGSPFARLDPPWLLPGNHDHGLRLRSALGRRALLAPRLVESRGWQVLLLDSQLSGSVAGRLGARQLAWIEAVLAGSDLPLLVAVHHPPLPIGDPGFDAKLADMQKDNSVYDIASIYAVQDVIRPEQTRNYLLRMLDVHQLRKSGSVGRHLLSSWPTSF